MKKLILAAASGLALLTVAACSDSTDNTTTQSVQPLEDPAIPVTPAPEASPPADDPMAPSSPSPAPVE